MKGALEGTSGRIFWTARTSRTIRIMRIFCIFESFELSESSNLQKLFKFRIFSELVTSNLSDDVISLAYEFCF